MRAWRLARHGLAERAPAGELLAVEVEPFGRLQRGARPANAEEAERLAAFLGGELALAYA